MTAGVGDARTLETPDWRRGPDRGSAEERKRRLDLETSFDREKRPAERATAATGA